VNLAAPAQVRQQALGRTCSRAQCLDDARAQLVRDVLSARGAQRAQRLRYRLLAIPHPVCNRQTGNPKPYNRNSKTLTPKILRVRGRQENLSPKMFKGQPGTCNGSPLRNGPLLGCTRVMNKINTSIPTSDFLLQVRYQPIAANLAGPNSPEPSRSIRCGSN
jgi:hypothetical protein